MINPKYALILWNRKTQTTLITDIRNTSLNFYKWPYKSGAALYGWKGTEHHFQITANLMLQSLPTELVLSTLNHTQPVLNISDTSLNNPIRTNIPLDDPDSFSE